MPQPIHMHIISSRRLHPPLLRFIHRLCRVPKIVPPGFHLHEMKAKILFCNNINLPSGIESWFPKPEIHLPHTLFLPSVLQYLLVFYCQSYFSSCRAAGWSAACPVGLPVVPPLLGPFDSCRLLVLPLYHIPSRRCDVPNKKDFSPGKKYQKWAFVNRAPSGPVGRKAAGPWFAYENRIHWVCGLAYANREDPEAGFRRGRPALVCVRKPNSLAFRGGVRKPGSP